MNYKFIFILLFITSVAYSKVNTKPGYVITNNGDTLSGKVIIESLYKHHQLCRFIPDGYKKEKRFYPQDIHGYKIENGEYYVSRKVNKDSLFLVFLVDGIKDLYYYKNKEHETFYIEDEESGLMVLNNTEKIIYSEQGSRHAINKKEYIGVLKYQFKEVPELDTQIENSEFTHKSLVKLTKKYHDATCSEYECMDYLRTSKTNIYLGLKLGNLHQFLYFYSPDGKEQLPSSNNIYVGVNLHYANMFGLHERLSMESTLSCFVSKFDNKHFEYDGVELLVAPIDVNYSFLSGQFKPFISGGLNLCAELKEEFNPQGSYGYTLSGGFDKKTIRVGYNLGLGLTWAKHENWNIDLRIKYLNLWPIENKYFSSYYTGRFGILSSIGINYRLK
ncbi:MAG: porin family protein [Bacteroidales bacterium]|nr:porin family protein [Bacteroidales bacterium]